MSEKKNKQGHQSNQQILTDEMIDELIKKDGFMKRVASRLHNDGQLAQKFMQDINSLKTGSAYDCVWICPPATPNE